MPLGPSLVRVPERTLWNTGAICTWTYFVSRTDDMLLLFLPRPDTVKQW